MSTQFLAEIRIFPFDFAPKGWALCNGQLLLISRNTALFSLIQTIYGGDGKVTFGLPNLDGSVPIHTTQYCNDTTLGEYELGSYGGADYITLTNSDMPVHTHNVQGDSKAFDANTFVPTTAYPGNAGAQMIYSNSATPKLAYMNPAMIPPAGGGMPHTNLMPYLTLNYCIALTGVFPPRS
jgi:microcystin-dependent protein